MTYSKPLYSLTPNKDIFGVTPGVTIHHIDWDRKMVVFTQDLEKRSQTTDHLERLRNFRKFGR